MCVSDTEKVFKDFLIAKAIGHDSILTSPQWGTDTVFCLFYENLYTFCKSLSLQGLTLSLPHMQVSETSPHHLQRHPLPSSPLK